MVTCKVPPFTNLNESSIYEKVSPFPLTTQSVYPRVTREVETNPFLRSHSEDDITNKNIKYNIENIEDVIEKNLPKDEIRASNMYFDGRTLVKCLLIGSSVIFIRYTMIMYIEKPDEILNYIKSFDTLPVQVQILIIFVVVVTTIFFIKKTHQSISQNNSANHVFKQIRENLNSDYEMVLAEDDIIGIYSEELKISFNYFKESIFPEVKRLARLDKNIEISKQIFQNEECEVEAWSWLQ